jgi:hypothetical protein
MFMQKNIIIFTILVGVDIESVSFKLKWKIPWCFCGSYKYIANDSMVSNTLLGPRVNPLEGSPNVKLRKVGTKGTLPASNSRKG